MVKRLHYLLTHTKASLWKSMSPFHKLWDTLGDDTLPGLSAAVEKSAGWESDWRVGSAGRTSGGSVCLHLQHPHVPSACSAGALLPAGPGFCLLQREASVNNSIQKTCQIYEDTVPLEILRQFSLSAQPCRILTEGKAMQKYILLIQYRDTLLMFKYFSQN